MATELADGIHWFELTGVNAYLVEDDVLTLVDAGTPFDAPAIEAGIKDAGHTVGDVERVLLTHYDFDHAGALAHLTDLDATVRAGAIDAGLLTGARKPPLGNHKGLLQRATGPFVRSPALPVEPIADGERVGSFTAHHTPGHTPGHMSFEIRNGGDAAFVSGDAISNHHVAFARPGWESGSDQDMPLAAQTRTALMDRLAQDKLLLLGFHLPGGGIGRVERTGGAYRFLVEDA